MKFRTFASFVGIDWNGKFRPDPDDAVQFGWTDHEIIVYSNSYVNARKKIWKWAKARGARQRQIMFVDEKTWRQDKCYRTRILK